MGGGGGSGRCAMWNAQSARCAECALHNVLGGWCAVRGVAQWTMLKMCSLCSEPRAVWNMQSGQSALCRVSDAERFESSGCSAGRRVHTAQRMHCDVCQVCRVRRVHCSVYRAQSVQCVSVQCAEFKVHTEALCKSGHCAEYKVSGVPCATFPPRSSVFLSGRGSVCTYPGGGGNKTIRHLSNMQWRCLHHGHQRPPGANAFPAHTHPGQFSGALPPV